MAHHYEQQAARKDPSRWVIGVENDPGTSPITWEILKKFEENSHSTMIRAVPDKALEFFETARTINSVFCLDKVDLTLDELQTLRATFHGVSWLIIQGGYNIDLEKISIRLQQIFPVHDVETTPLSSPPSVVLVNCLNIVFKRLETDINFNKRIVTKSNSEQVDDEELPLLVE